MKLKFRAELKDIVIFVIFCIFLLYVVAVGVINLASFAREGYFVGWNPFPAFAPEYIVTTIAFFFLALVAVFMSVSSLFFEREEGFGITTEKKEETGYSSWLNEEKVKKLEGVKRIRLKEDKYEACGIPLLLNEKEAYVDSGENHSMIIGSTGSGKTQCVILPMVKIFAKGGESMIITDPKGEIYQKTGNLLKKQGYKIILLNFREPLNGNAWNPFTLPYKYYKEGKQDKSMELLEDLGSNILVDPNNKGEPFWEQSASDYFAGLSIGLFEDAKEEEININSINLMATVGDERIGASTYIKEYFGLKDQLSPAVVSASSTINAPSDTKGGIVSTFRTKTRIFSSRETLSEMLGHSDFDFSQIAKEKTAVFLMIHDEKKTYHALATIFVKQAYESLVDVAFGSPEGKLPIRTNFLLDEFANMPALRDVDAMITASRSRNIRFNFIIQNYSQLNQTYGPDMAETIKGNCGNIHFLLTTELKALEEISKLCGDEKPKKAKEGMPAEPIRPLVSISDLQQMKQFEFLIKRLRTNPFKTKFKADFELIKAGSWGENYPAADFPTRESTGVAVFDLKEYVRKKKLEMGQDINAGPMGGRGFVPPFMPGMGGMPGIPPGMGGGMPGIPPSMGGGVPSGFHGPMPSGMPNPQMAPKPQGGPQINLDDFMKRLDEKIAALEAEEASEKAKVEGKELPKPEEKRVDVKPDDEDETGGMTAEEIEKEIASILGGDEKPNFPKEIKQEPPISIPDSNPFASFMPPREEPMPSAIKEQINGNLPNNSSSMFGISKEEQQVKEDIKQSESLFEQPKPLIEPEILKQSNEKPQIIEEKENQTDKPKVNIDVESIIVKDNPTDDDFFDDFFADE